MANITALNAALSGLKIAQNNIGLISNNISNVNTAGYTRKTQAQSTLVSTGIGQGVLANNVQRTVDAFLQRELVDQRAVAAGLETKQKYFQQIQDFHGAAENENALSNQIGKLRDSFIALANDPSKDYLLNDVSVQANETVDKIHDFNDLLTRLRNDAQTEMKQIVVQINTLTEQIGNLNLQIKSQAVVGRTTADLEDQRDIAVAELAEYIDVSYFERGDKVLVVQTQRGTPLVGDNPHELFFNAEPIGTLTYYPASVASINLDDPLTGTNLTDQDDLGGKLGALTEMRDTIFPEYQAQLDELSYRMAERFDAQGLRLFSLSDETLPTDDATQEPPFGYAGFARRMQVNPDIIADKNLIRSGTTGNTVAIGSAELVRKIVDFTFGNSVHQQGLSTFDLTSATNAGISGTSILTSYGTLDTHPAINPGTSDTFSIDLGGGGAINIAITAGQTATDLVNTINASFPALASLGPNGNLRLNSTQDITIGDVNLGAGGLDALGLTAGTVPAANIDTLYDQLGLSNRARIIGTTDLVELNDLGTSDYINPIPAVPNNDTFQLSIGGGAATNITVNFGDTVNDLVNTINTTYPGLASLGPNGNLVMSSLDSIAITDVNLGTVGLAELGLVAATTNPSIPNFTVQVGNKTPVQIDIVATDTNVELLAKLNAVEGIEATFTVPDGFLQIIPTEGGDISLNDGTSNPLSQMGLSVTNVAHTGFSTGNVGPGGTLSGTGISRGAGLIEYATETISKQSQDAANIDTNITAEQIYRDTLQSRQSDNSGVNIDEELANLIQIQNNYAASAKAIQIIEEMFSTLMATFGR